MNNARRISTLQVSGTLFARFGGVAGGFRRARRQGGQGGGGGKGKAGGADLGLVRRCLCSCAGVFPVSEHKNDRHGVCVEGQQCQRGAKKAVGDINSLNDDGTYKHPELMKFDLFQFLEELPNGEYGETPITNQTQQLERETACGVATGEELGDFALNCCPGRMPECQEYCVVVHSMDSKADPGLALHVADVYLNTPWDAYAGIDLFVGGLTSDVSIALNQLLQHNSVPQISYGSTSATLSDKTPDKGFPTFFRTVPSDGRLVEGVLEFIEEVEWKIVTLLCVQSEFGQSVATDMYQGLADNEVEVANNLLFNDDNIAEHLMTIKESESRVIFLHCGAAQVQLVMEWAFRLDMLQEGYAWVGSEWASPTLFDEMVVHEDEAPWPPLVDVLDHATIEELKEAMVGIVALRASTLHDDVAVVAAVDGAVLAPYAQQEKDKCSGIESATHVSQYAHFAYDAVLLGVEAMQRSMRVNPAGGGSHHQWDFAATTDELKSMESTATGVQGAATANVNFPLRLDDNGDRILPYDIVNLRADITWLEGAPDTYAPPRPPVSLSNYHVFGH